MSKRRGVVIRESWNGLIFRLPRKESKQMIIAVNRYLHDGVPTEFAAKPMAAIFNRIKSDIDRDNNELKDVELYG